MDRRHRTARWGLAAFLLAGSAAVTNIFFLQTRVAAELSESRSRKRPDAEIERERRLALSFREARSRIPPEPTRQAARPQAVTSDTGRIANFAPSALRAGVMRLPENVSDERKTESIRSIQRVLADRGYEPGPVDGVLGAATRAAIMAYEHDHGLPITADASEQLLAHLDPSNDEAYPRAGRPGRMPHAEQLVRSVQQSMTMLGYFSGRIDGWPGTDTVRAIREFEAHAGLPVTGRVSARLLARIDDAMQNTRLRTGSMR